MANVRIIARLDIKGPNLIKGMQLEGLRVIGDPNTYAHKYYQAGIDEIIYMDAVASLYGRNSLDEVVQHTAQDIFVPITVGGGIRSVEDARRLLRVGADKIAINTAATKRPELITEIANTFGSQCMVLSIEAKHIDAKHWQAFTDNGREKTGMDVIEWAQRGESLGAGEILLTSVDHEGMRGGFDCELVHAVSSAVSIPVIASGGFAKAEHLVDVVDNGLADAVAIADALHYDRMDVADIRAAALEHGVNVRCLPR